MLSKIGRFFTDNCSNSTSSSPESDKETEEGIFSRMMNSFKDFFRDKKKEIKTHQKENVTIQCFMCSITIDKDGKAKEIKKKSL